MRFAMPSIARTAAIALALALLIGSMVALARPAEAAGSKAVLRAGVVHLTNVHRLTAGCRPLTVSGKLTTAAQRHAKDMSRKRYFSHSSANGTQWWQRIERAGYRDPGGENIAQGYGGAASVVRAWLDSPGHRKNIRNCQFKTIGIGFSGAGDYWVQDFGY